MAHDQLTLFHIGKNAKGVQLESLF